MTDWILPMTPVMPASHEAERLTSRLRFVTANGKPVLQQLWLVEKTTPGHPVIVHEDWRDVPTVEEGT